jgi:predicted MPP superfamily phosphohydrolase
MIRDLVVNAALLAVNAGILAALWKKRDPKIFAALVVGGGIAAVMIAGVLGGGLFGAMRALAWAIFLHGVLLLAGGAVLLWKSHRKSAVASLVLAALVAGVGIDAFFIEPYQLEVTRFTMHSAKVTRPLKIVIIADLQTDVIGEYERSALKRAMEEKPDLVLFAGDYIQEYEDKRRRELIAELHQLVKDMGARWAVAVEGNCDYDDWPYIFEGTDVSWTQQTRSIKQGEAQVTALSMENSFNTRLAVPPADRFHIAMGHSPDFALGDVKADLLVAGHTHGGQVRLPGIGPLITLSRVPRSWAAGATRLDRGPLLVVSRGVGMERGAAPRLRFLCRPELVIVDVVPAK